jgi:hypothetical protein
MKFLLAVLLPLLVQAGFTVAVIAGTSGGGSFVGLGAMLLAPPAILITAAINWLGVRRQPPLPLLHLVTRTFYLTLVFPVLLLVLAALAS